jgi:hypothetical protein
LSLLAKTLNAFTVLKDPKHQSPRNDFMTFIYWRVSLLLLSWALLGVGLMLINLSVAVIDRATFGCVLIASASYLISTYAALKPLTKGECCESDEKSNVVRNSVPD